MMNYVFEEHPEIIANMKKHFYLRSIAEAFSKILSKYGDEGGLSTNKNKYNEERIKLLDQLFEMLGENENPEVNSNVAYVICNILQKGSLVTDNIILLQTLASDKYVNTLVDKIKTKVNPSNN